LADGDEYGYEFQVQDAKRTKYSEEEIEKLLNWLEHECVHIRHNPNKGEEVVKRKDGEPILCDLCDG